ncbi:zinc-ribbon domain-containing protein, partial [Achromobacter sp.]|uniref:zinc-ribbon domain-containing protein n=1 Tax=Achromobacter sp. TaxID=134375 RepID=UPI003C77D4D9
MALTTRCPQCGTTFKVVLDQLRVRNGLVRCGACSTVFDGRACLVPAAGMAPPLPTPPAAA